MSLSPSFAGVILAAGASSRMGQDKARLPWRDGTFLSAAIQALQAETELVIVVAGANAVAITPIVNANAAYLVVNPSPGNGQLSSLQAGLHEVLNRGRDAALVTLVDRPAPAPETVRRIKNEFLALSNDDRIWAVVPEYQGRHGHPIAIGREMMEAFLRAPWSNSAREVEHAHQPHIRWTIRWSSRTWTHQKTSKNFDRELPVEGANPASRRGPAIRRFRSGARTPRGRVRLRWHALVRRFRSGLLLLGA
jgi:molybdenum cofactor cytidylyltransferase